MNNNTVKDRNTTAESEQELWAIQESLALLSEATKELKEKPMKRQRAEGYRTQLNLLETIACKTEGGRKAYEIGVLEFKKELEARIPL